MAGSRRIHLISPARSGIKLRRLAPFAVMASTLVDVVRPGTHICAMGGAAWHPAQSGS